MNTNSIVVLPDTVQAALFGPEISEEFTSSPKLRTFPITGDTMEPTLRRGDFVMAVPVTRYLREGIYIVEDNGFPTVYRVQRWNGANELRMVQDHPALQRSPQIIARDLFDDRVIGLVVARINVMEPTALRNAVAA